MFEQFDLFVLKIVFVLDLFDVAGTDFDILVIVVVVAIAIVDVLGVWVVRANLIIGS